MKRVRSGRCKYTLLLLTGLAMNGWGQNPSSSTDWAQILAADQKQVQGNPDDANAWEKLGNDAMQAGKYPDAVHAFQQANDKGYPPLIGRYNLACAYARLGDKQKALDLLESMAATGFPGPIAGDPDLASLTSEPRFQKIAQVAQLAAEPCKDGHANPEYRQLDFWVGEWNVFSGKQKVGESSVRLILKDCVVFENWHGLQGGDGKSLNKYNNVTHQWEQFWVADDGTTNYFKGALADGEMRYVYETPTATGGTLVRHLTFSKLADGSVRQFSQRTIDGGKTWATEYDLVYVRRQ